MTFAQRERQELCQIFHEVGPQAPTLCGTWTTYDLAAHLWLRENDPLGAPGIVVKPLADFTERRMRELMSKWTYDELVTRLLDGPSALSLFSLPGVDEAANTIEYFIHHEDVRRAITDWKPRALPEAEEEWLWRRLKLMSRVFFRKAPVGLVLENSLTGEHARAMPGTPIVNLIGTPSELMMYAYGRQGHAIVELVGDDAALDRMRKLELGI